MKKFLFLFLILIFSNNVFAETTWITKKNSKTSKEKTLEQMYVDGLLTRSECIKAKKKVLKSQSISGCKKIETEDESTVTYIAKKKKTKPNKWGSPLCTKYNKVAFLSDVKNCTGYGGNYIIRKDHSAYDYYFSKVIETQGEIVSSDIAEKTEEEKKKKKVAKKKVEKYVPEETQDDNIKPNIEIASTVTFKDPEYVLKGKVTDKGGSEKFYLFYQKGKSKKKLVKLENGKFKIERFSIDNEEIKLIAIDEYRNETTKVVKVLIAMEEETEVASVYDELKPIKKGQRDNKRVAIIIGVESYEKLPNRKALYANNDAEMFKNFANRSLGISPSNIKVLIDSKARKMDIIETLKLWLPKKITPNQSELFVFFSSHGYPSEEGLHLIPHDGHPRLLEESALSHKYIINQIVKTKPKSVTMFLDACYSGQSKTGEVLVAGLKQIDHVATNEDIPPNFNIFSSSKSNQVSATIKEAEHGIFSYYLMKGLEGEADLDKDNQISNNELFVYLQKMVSKEAFNQNREQNPILTSQNPDQILMKY